MGREFELKFRADAAILSAIAEKYGSFVPISMETTYYDTPDRVLRSRHWTLRRRFENGVSVCTVKTPAAVGGRGEWETECPEIMQAVPDLIALGAPLELVAFTSQGVEPVCGARFTRLAALVEAEGCTVELALDRGVLMGGGKELPFAEVEVELKAGTEAATVLFAKALAAEYGLTPETKSKVQRALALTNP